MRVALFGAYDAGYPRTRVLREGLAARGIEAIEIGVAPRTRPGVREIGLVLSWLKRARRIDAILVPSFGHRDVPLAELLGRAADAPVLFDPLVSRWDTQVHDLGRIPERSLSARRMRGSDRMALNLADMVLCDTWEHGDFYSTEFGVSRRRLSRVPVGADALAFQLGDRRGTAPRGSQLDVVYVGGYLPLHGLSSVIDAATVLEAKHGPRFAVFTLIGDGMLRQEVERGVAARGLRSVRFLPRMPYEEALARLSRADVGLGIFGVSQKAGRVVPHKVYQSMAMGVPTVTRRSAAIAEFFRDEEHLVLVPAGDGSALARALEALAGDPARSARISAQGRASVRAQASPARIGDLLVEAIQRSREATAPSTRR